MLFRQLCSSCSTNEVDAHVDEYTPSEKVKKGEKSTSESFLTAFESVRESSSQR